MKIQSLKVLAIALMLAIVPLSVPTVYAGSNGNGNNVAGGLPAEIAARKAADAELQANINSEESARIAADTALKDQIDNIVLKPGPVYILGDEGPSGPGSKVFYVDGSGEHGLEAQAADEPSDLDWSRAVEAAAAHNSPPCPTPALRTPSCWHLPTKTELELLYEQKKVVGGFFSTDYWSSLIEQTHGRWAQDFGNGSQNFDYRSWDRGVRAVRAF